MRRILVLGLAFLTVGGCARTTRAVRLATHSTLTLPNKAADPQMVEKHCPFGAPTKLDSLEHGPTTLIGCNAYVLEHDGASKIPL